MLNKITSRIFNLSVIAVALATAVWLTVTGHTLLVEGLLLAFGGIVMAIFFAFRLAEDRGSHGLSIWVGPFAPRFRSRRAADDPAAGGIEG